MSIALEFLGAAGTVTGSKTLLHFGRRKHLIDCGLFQGPKELRARNWARFVPPAQELASVILTHAHLDHSGYLPRLTREGFNAPIHASKGTADVAELLLLDAAHLQEEDADFANRSHYSNHDPALPLFDTADARKALALFKSHERDQWIAVDEGLGVRFLRSGHIIGSSFVQLSLTVEGQPRLITFSGDIGHDRSHTLKGPVDVTETDILVLESTYGDREQPRTDPLDALAEIATRTFARKGVLVIPAFAVGRSQEVLHLFRLLEDAGKIPRVPVLLDSPLSNSATRVFLDHPEDTLFDLPFRDGVSGFLPHRFETVATPDDSMMACMRSGPLVVISAAGMLNGGRILHHLKHRLPHRENTVLFVGYQGEGTKGRYLQEQGKAAGTLRIHHKEVSVEAEIATLTHLSAHGDAQDLVDWVGRFRRKPKRIFLNHGSAEASLALAARLKTELGINAEAMLAEGRVPLW
jgi:metallo-beta-lactamase family protein